MSGLGGNCGAMSASFQTVTLARGKHTSPRSGACVMELASMLAGEPFTDRPAAVCPIVAAFLRAYNDAIDDPHRQDLYAYASAAVGTRGSWPLMRMRARLCLEELRALRRTPLGLLTSPRALPESLPAMERLAGRVARELRRSGLEGHARALRLADDLIGLGAPAAISAPWRDIDARVLPERPGRERV
ncbi:MAG: hypothetical protein QOD44_1861 [Solirubrobacteraceae bacterium]|nr:hypothetical protein [Solirubrobacteraceae bacterium]